MLFEDANGVRIFVETKNYASTTSFSTSFYNQFKAYISSQEITDISQIKYYFRANSGVSKASQVQKFKNMISNNAKAIFESNPNVFTKIKKENQIDFIDDWEDLKIMMDSETISLDHQIFSFIQVY
ncbi:MAG: hypothetical protein IPM74_04020 [Crocinitomicaceae bacterium]|nr:hypothetical protein [Crocinitomicaceae bacterium]MBK8925074.1 hypothetical protein [Crocinitomicaceae bacterium]